MKAPHLVAIWFLAILIGCAPAGHRASEMANTYAPVETSLTHINQKVANHFIRGIPDSFNRDEYMAAIDEVCRSKPECLSEAKAIFDSYGVKVRKVDDMFSVMLCDKDLKWKVMEDFSCNNLRVEVKTWMTGNSEKCAFETNWQRVKQEFCRQ